MGVEYLVVVMVAGDGSSIIIDGKSCTLVKKVVMVAVVAIDGGNGRDDGAVVMDGSGGPQLVGELRDGSTPVILC